MRTPAGKECPYYYANYHRGRETEECRLVAENPDSAPWQPRDCARCPVPDILLANASPNLRLKLTIRPKLMGFKRQMDVRAWCEKHDIVIEDPYTGCPLCAEENPGLKLFKDALG
ncbi:MAG TPA: hypothetical protein PKD09_24035 [Aggregatilinea sp.]|jgi:hypothetical protein|uniref:hypothetical protein n=1 Tax=Aggregatilinea sp. TaxID=2806333 RepID=UPI002CA8874A|nr:hypothetical protein [Aggregatilinea sp.]HML24746.1 hypothetical protein [Aggregatilinea sp.]